MPVVIEVRDWSRAAPRRYGVNVQVEGLGRDNRAVNLGGTRTGEHRSFGIA